MGRLFILTGASGSGKTELLNGLLRLHKEEFNMMQAKKYSTRERRNDNDDIEHSASIDISNFDLVYNLNNVRYGIKYDEIEQQINTGKNVFIILSYIRVIKQLKERFKNQVSVIYVSSAVDSKRLDKIHTDRYIDSFCPTEEQNTILWEQFKKLKISIELERWKDLFACMAELNNEWKQYLPLNDSLEVRQTKLRDFHKSYLDNIYLFDHVVLNYKFDEEERADGIKGYDMYLQGYNIMKYYTTTEMPKRTKSKPVIFVVAAAAVAGKGILLETVGDTIEKSVIKVISKQAKRESKPKDKRDGMIAIGENGIFGADFDITWEFHKDDKSGKGVEYAISSKEVAENTKNGCSQIVISNMGQFDMFREKYNDRVVFIYLHRLQSVEDKKEYLYNNETPEDAEKKLKESDKVYDEYIKRLAEFDHVLLNTSFQEDLYEQIFTLIDYYNNN